MFEAMYKVFGQDDKDPSKAYLSRLEMTKKNFKEGNSPTIYETRGLKYLNTNNNKNNRYTCQLQLKCSQYLRTN